MNVPAIPCVERSISPGDRVLFYTDGITEREDYGGNMYEIHRLMDAFHALRAASRQNSSMRWSPTSRGLPEDESPRTIRHCC
jgi:stage II sporulation SpoE-like protein